MPEETTTEATTPEVTAASVLAELTQETEETEETKVATADEGTTEDDDDDADGLDDSLDDDNAALEDENIDDLPSKLALDESIADKLPDEVKERYEQQVKGLAKLQKQIADREALITQDEKGYQVYTSYVEAFADPNIAWKAYKQLGEQIKQLHGEASVNQEVTETEYGAFSYDGKVFMSQQEVELYKDIQALKANKDPEIEEMLRERAEAKQAQELTNWVAKIAEKVIAKVAYKAEGWKVTQDQILAVAKADRKGLTEDPVKALKSAFPDDFANHKASQGKQKPKVADMVDASQAKGFKIPDNPDEYSAAHALMEISG